MNDASKLQPPVVVELKSKAGRSLFVRTTEATVVEAPPRGEGEEAPYLPEGADAIGAEERLSAAFVRVQCLIDDAAGLVAGALTRHAPDEISVELSIGFTGKVDPIPFLVGAEAEAAMKVTIAWKNGKSQ